MKPVIRIPAAVLLVMVLLFGSAAVRAEEPERVTPSESFYGYADRERIRALRAGADAGLPEGLSGADAEVYRKLVSTGRISHIARTADELETLPAYPVLSRMLCGFQRDHTGAGSDRQ